MAHSRTWPAAGFFQTFIRPHVSKEERVFVIISDALRYEAARELCEQINKERRGVAETFALQGVLPSATKFGMASLLPHKCIELDGKNEIYVDDIRAEGTEYRQKILCQHVPDSVARSYNDIANLSQKALRQIVQGKKVIYIYHNMIDATGDHWATERQVFAAVEDTFRVLKILINDLVNSVSAGTIYITEDHAILGSISIGGTINKVEELASVLQVCFDAGAKKVLLPIVSAADIATVPPDLFVKFQISFYQSAEDAVFKALGAE